MPNTADINDSLRLSIPVPQGLGFGEKYIAKVLFIFRRRAKLVITGQTFCDHTENDFIFCWIMIMLFLMAIGHLTMR